MSLKGTTGVARLDAKILESRFKLGCLKLLALVILMIQAQ